jgi:hypothetical protein
MEQQHLERFHEKQMMLDKLTPPGWEDAADYFRETDKKNGTSVLRVPAVVQQRTDVDAAPSAPTTIGELQECLGIVPGISQLPQGISLPGCSHIKLGSRNLQLNPGILDLLPAAKPDSSVNQNVNLAALFSFYPGIY